MIHLKRLDVLKRKLNYQHWDSIDQPAPEPLAVIKVNRVVVFEGLLAEETYALDLDVRTEPFPCVDLTQGLHITIFDQDQTQTKEPIGELTHRLKAPPSAPSRLNLSGGAVRQLIFEVVLLPQ